MLSYDDLVKVDKSYFEKNLDLIKVSLSQLTLRQVIEIMNVWTDNEIFEENEGVPSLFSDDDVLLSA